MRNNQSSRTAYRLLAIAISLVMGLGVFAVPEVAKGAGKEMQLDYIKGRPLTEAELQEQKDLVPKLEEPLPETDMESTPVEVVDTKQESELVQSTNGRYDSRDQSWYQYVKVEDQGATGLCWAYAMSTAMEIAYYKMKGSKGKKLSGAHLGYFFFHRANDPLKNTKLDKNTVIDSTKWYQVGGTSELTLLSLAGWIGAATESVVPESKKTASSISSSLCYKDSVILKNATYLNDTDEIKQAIMKNGCVEAQVYLNANSSKYYNPDTGAYYYDGGGSTNHEVVIIGWDDNYSRENFQSDRQPDKDGAWIVQNSYGSKWADNGCFYLSYEDAALLSAGKILSVEVQPASTYKYNYQYDGSASYYVFKLYKGEKVGNIFKVPGSSIGRSQLLKAVGIVTWKENAKYRIDVYKNLTSRSRPTKGEKVCTKYITADKTGYYTIKLPKTVRLKTGSYFSVVVTARNTTSFGAEESYTLYSGDTGIRFKTGHASKRSFAYVDGSWEDLYSVRASARIKAFTVPSAAVKNLTVKAKGKTYVKLGWDKLSGYNGYVISQKINGKYKPIAKRAGISKTTYKVTKLKPGQTYKFRVRAYKVINDVTYYSGVTKIVTVKTKSQ